MNVPIRNFCIIAHIDHGKTTLSDRFIQATKTIEDRLFENQLLDSMDLEKERGITIKSQVVSMPYVNINDGQTYLLNLVDTPGHVDFSYEVSRAVASCEGALLLVDATQGIQAQTLSHFYLALEKNLEIIPVINKVDLANAQVEQVRKQIVHELGLDGDKIVEVSAKTGLGMSELFFNICSYIPPPKIDDQAPLQALIFDSHYDPYKGALMHVRVMQGSIRNGDRIQLVHSDKNYTVEQVGQFRIGLHPCQQLSSGQVGYIVANIKDISNLQVGDTVIGKDSHTPALEGFQPSKPMVFSSIYPIDASDYQEFSKALEKLKLNDASFHFEKDSSVALGFGYRCGFLGLLHMEVIQQRLEREFGLNLILTAPSVVYKVKLSDGGEILVDNPEYYPDSTKIALVEEPYIRAQVIVPQEYLGPILELCTQKRGIQKNLYYLDTQRIELTYEMPLSEVLFDFYDKLKSYSKGYASFDYQLIDYQPTQLSRLDILLNGQKVDVLAQLVYKGHAYERAKYVCSRLKEQIPKQQFVIAIQGAIGSKIIARETISAYRKDVIAKCYGGDISRKRKLLEKQKEGKKRMKMVGNIELPQKAFIAVLKNDS